MKTSNIEVGTIVYICALTAEGIDAESISRRIRVDEKRKQKVNVHDTSLVATIFNNWRKHPSLLIQPELTDEKEEK